MYGVFPTSDCLDEVQAIVCSGGQYHSVTNPYPSFHTHTHTHTQTDTDTGMHTDVRTQMYAQLQRNAVLVLGEEGVQYEYLIPNSIKNPFYL